MLVNPKVISHSVQHAYLPTGEGCLSVDENIPGLVHVIIEQQLKLMILMVMKLNYV